MPDRSQVHILHLHLAIDRFDQLCLIAESQGTLATMLATDWVLDRLRKFDQTAPGPLRSHDHDRASGLQMASVRQLPLLSAPDEVAVGSTAVPVTPLIPPAALEQGGDPGPIRLGRRVRSR